MNKKTIKAAITVIILGAFGSGLWSIVGAPFTKWFSESFISAAQFVNAGYYNLLHENIGKALHEEDGVFFRTLFSATMALVYLSFPLISYSFFKKSQSIENDEEIPKKQLLSIVYRNKMKILLGMSIVLSIVASPVYISRIIVSNYNNNAVVFIERSIEILAPNLAQQEILKLRAQYRTISDAEGFYLLYDNLLSKAKIYSIKLPEFDVAR